MQEFQKAGDIKQFFDPCSIIIKVVDNQRAAHFLQDFKTYPVEKRLMLAEDQKRYNFVADSQQKQAKTVEKLLPIGAVVRRVEEAAFNGFENLIDDL